MSFILTTHSNIMQLCTIWMLKAEVYIRYNNKIKKNNSTSKTVYMYSFSKELAAVYFQMVFHFCGNGLKRGIFFFFLWKSQKGEERVNRGILGL